MNLLKVAESQYGVKPETIVYLGDGVYIGRCPYQVWVFTPRENGLNVIAFENVEMVEKLMKYARSVFRCGHE